MCTFVVDIGTLERPSANLGSLPSRRTQDTKAGLYEALPVPADIRGCLVCLRCSDHVGAATNETKESGRNAVGVRHVLAVDGKLL